MDTTKHNRALDSQDSSDDLIAELARLVAQDARSQSINSDRYQRSEPSFAATESQPDPVSDFTSSDSNWSKPEPAFDVSPADATGGYEQADDLVALEDDYAEDPVADQSDEMAGFAPDLTDYDAVSIDPQGEPVDPIADLIFSVEEEQFSASLDEDNYEPAEDAPSIHAVPVPSNVEPVQDSNQNWDTGYQQETAQTYAEPQAPAYEPESQYHPYSEAEAVPASPSDERDPLRDIEALIGDAVRVSAAAGQAGGRRVRSSYLDEPELEAERSDDVDSAEAAILAATAASDGEFDAVYDEPEELIVQDDPSAEAMVDPFFAARPQSAVESEFNENTEFEAVEPVRHRRRSGGILLPAALGALILAAIGGVYFTFFAGPSDPADAPVLEADGAPLRQDVEPSVSNTAASQSVVFNEIDGNTTAVEDEALVSRDQTDGATGDAISSILAPETTEMGLANRPVRTVTVRPDGTIVSTEDSIAGTNVLPVDRPDVPAVPNSTLTADPIGEAIAAAMASGDLDTTAQPLIPQEPTPAVAEPVISAPTVTDAVVAVPAAPAVSSEEAPRPIPRPQGLSVPSTATAAPVASAPSTVASAPVPQMAPPVTPAQPTSATGPVGAWVQLASQRSEDVAREGMAQLQSRYGTLFNGAALEVNRVDLGERGVYYRVRLPQPSMTAANSVCNAVKGQGGDCFVLNN